MKTRKRLSFLKIVLLLVITAGMIWAFQMQYERFHSEDYPVKAVIIQQVNTSSGGPVIATYRWHRAKHWLILYTVEQDDKFLFKAIDHKRLDAPVEELMADKKSNGVWVKIEGKWRYFNENLQEEERDGQNRDPKSNESFPFTINREENIVEIQMNDNDTLHFPITEHEELQALYPMSGDRTLWLGVYEDDLKIIMK